MPSAKRKADAFNARVTVGQAVRLELDDHTFMDTRLASEAWVIGGHSAVAKVAGKSGGWDVGRIHPAAGQGGGDR